MKWRQMYDVYFLSKPHPPMKGDAYEVVCSLEDGYSAFLAPLFAKVNEEAGKTIVHVDWAHFCADDLKLLLQIIVTARKRMVAREENWDVLIGRDGNNKLLYAKVTKHKMNLFLGKIEEAIRKAQSSDACISFNFWGGGG